MLQYHATLVTKRLVQITGGDIKFYNYKVTVLSKNISAVWKSYKTEFK